MFDIILNRGNDLTEFFWPIIYYIKNQITLGNGIPLWNIMFFSGTPLLPDPQNLFIYPLNIIFLFLPIDIGLLISIAIHILIAFLGMYMLLKINNFTKLTSIIVAILFALSPKLFSYLEAGHLGLIQSWAFIPWVYWTTININTRKNFKSVLLLSLFLFLVYTSHILIFLILVTTNAIFFLTQSKKAFKMFLISHLILLFILLPILIPQVKWQSQTTRNLLLENPETYPVWNGKKEFIQNIFIANRDTEKNITAGIVVILLSLIGFIKLNIKHKLNVLISLSVISLLALNILKYDWFILFRVSTRFWFPAVILILILTAKGLDYLINKNKWFLVFGIFAIIEYILIGKFIIERPMGNISHTPTGIIDFLKNDKEVYRVFCLNKCIRQKDASIHNIELVEGYGTLQQRNYFEYSQQLAQGYWEKKYTLSVPPYQNYIFEKFKPYPPALTAYRVKYIISPYELSIKNLSLVKKVNNYLIYQNALYINPNYEIYKPNFIRVKIINEVNSLVIPEVYNPDWNAYLNGTKKVNVFETLDRTRGVNIDKDTKFVDFKYEPLNLF
ncbi:MAG: membrane protein-like protein [uncultured bacterium]|nr:MAG: membrane protein-like protein [uncultured bacterium]